MSEGSSRSLNHKKRKSEREKSVQDKKKKDLGAGRGAGVEATDENQICVNKTQFLRQRADGAKKNLLQNPEQRVKISLTKLLASSICHGANLEKIKKST